MRNSVYILITLIILSSCSETKNTDKQDSLTMNRDFADYKERLMLRLWKMYPSWASAVGYHNYDSLLNIPDQDQRDRELEFVAAESDSLKNFKPTLLNDNNRTDYYLIVNQLNATSWGISEMRSFEWDPSMYNLGSTFGEMLNNTYEPLEVRLNNFYWRMSFIPAFYGAAIKNIKNPTIEHTQLAIDQNLGSLGVFEKDLPEALSKSDLTTNERSKIMERAESAITAIKDYVEWLKNLKNDQPRSFRLGADLYKKKFEFDIMSAYSPQEILRKAEDHKGELHKKMAEIAQKLWPEHMGNKAMPNDKLIMIKMMIDKLSVNHVSPDSFQIAIEQQLKTLTDFVEKKNLLYQDPSKPLVVRREPDYLAGVAGASINSPGPYDKTGNTYYNVGSLSGWKPERAESYLREYNHYILQILNIHEAIPGHYTQLIYSNKSPSIVKSILGNGAMVEGWAVYTERMMLEEGYGNDDPAMWLMYYKWNLRTTCNFILDYRVHNENMTREEVMRILTEEAFQQQAEAENKWKRLTLTQVQLTSYFTGYIEIYEFREELKSKLGEKFNLKEFHESFLSYGSSPVRDIRMLMLKELEEPK